MTRIPSTEKTQDFIFRLEIKKGTPLHDPDKPHLLVFEQYVEPAGSFYSMDALIVRDGQRASDVELRGVEHLRGSNLTCVNFSFYDSTHRIMEHDYLLTTILRFLDRGYEH